MLTELKNLEPLEPRIGLAWLRPRTGWVLRGQPAMETVLVVHGTFANPSERPADGPRHWWEPGGCFCEQLDRALSGRGAAARCWQHALVLGQSRSAWMPTFSWSGDNSEVARRHGARALAEQLERLEKHPGVERYHLVAHSHGGNVVRRALRLLAKPPAKLGEVVCLGTPFLHFRDQGVVRRVLRRVHWPLVLIIAAALWAGGSWLGQAEISQTWFLWMVLSGVLGCLAHYWGRTRENLRPVAGFLLCFQHDEAVALLRRCARLAVQPEVLLESFFSPGQGSSQEPRRRWLAHLGRWWHRSPRAWVERFVAKVRSWPVVGGLLQPLGVLVLVLCFRPYRPRLRLFFSSRLPFFRRSFFQFLEHYDPERGGFVDDLAVHGREPALSSGPGLAPKQGWMERVEFTANYPARAGQALAALASALAYFVIVPFDWLFGALAWLAEVASRFTLWLGLRVAGKSAFGMDVLGAAFAVGESCEVPPGFRSVAVAENVEADILQRVNESSAEVGQRLRSLLATDEGGVLIDELKTVFSNVDLMHAQYYQDDRIVAAVADLICRQQPAQVSNGTLDRF